MMYMYPHTRAHAHTHTHMYIQLKVTKSKKERKKNNWLLKTYQKKLKWMGDSNYTRSCFCLFSFAEYELKSLANCATGLTSIPQTSLLHSTFYCTPHQSFILNRSTHSYACTNYSPIKEIHSIMFDAIDPLKCTLGGNKKISVSQ